MAAKVLNIEVCDQTITVCRTARKGKGVRIFDSFVFTTPAECVSDGVISNPSLLGNELKKQLAAHGLHKVKNAVFSLSSSRIAVREVKLPPMKSKLIESAIRTNAEDYFPIDLKNYHITYCELDKATSAKPFNRILVLAAPISMLEGYFLLADKAGLTIKAIDSSGNSQYQALKQISSAGVTVYVDIGCSSSIVSFIREDKLLLQRTFAYGVDEMLSHYMSASGKTRENYLEVLNETDETHAQFVADKLLSQAEIQNDLERLVGGIMRSIDYFNSSQWDAAASRVVLIGLNRHIAGLRDLIAESTGLETLYLDNIPEYATLTNNAPNASAFVNCIGSGIAPLDLMPKQFLPARRITVDDDNSSIVPGVIMCSIIVAGAIIISLSAWLGYASARNDLISAQTELSALDSAKQTFDSYSSYKNSDSAMQALSALTNSPNADLVSFFTSLEKQMPSSMLILSAACTDFGIGMNLSVETYTEAADIISKLRGYENFYLVEVTDLKRTKNDAGKLVITFTVKCLYGPNPYLNKINPYNELVYPSNEPTDTTTDAATDPTAATESAAPSDTQAQQ